MLKELFIHSIIYLQVLEEISEDFKVCFGDTLFHKKPQTAGSTSTQTQVYLAYEFDFNYIIDIDRSDVEVLTQGKRIWYEVENEGVSVF